MKHPHRSLRPFAARSWRLAVCFVAGLGAPSAALAGGKPCDISTCPCVLNLVADLDKRGWLGVELEPDEQGAIAITKVVQGSPAQRAHLQVGDRLLEVNAIPYRKDSLADLEKVYKVLVANETVIYTVRRGEKTLKVAIKLDKVPEQLMAQWIGHHVMEAYALLQEQQKGGGGR
jgi:predicted metalloprotease with PDZ domain